MEAVGAVVTVTGLIGGVVKIASYLSDLKATWQYAGLSITMLSSSLWAVKAALEEIVEWRSTSKDKSQKSEQLDTNLEVCIQGCAVLVAFMENRLKEFDLENLSKYDKAKFMSLDTLFKGFANDLGAQVRALQLLLTIYQCRTLSEQNEKLQQKDTKKVVRAARQSTASLMYEDKDIEDAASILSEEAPSINFDFDRIIMQHQSYSRTYPGLYERMQRNFPSRRPSTVSTIIERPRPRPRPRPVEDPIIAQTANLPFLGVPFLGESFPLLEHELENQGESRHSAALAEFPNTMIAEFHETSIVEFPEANISEAPGTSIIPLPANTKMNAIEYGSAPLNEKDSSVDSDSRSLSKLSVKNRPILTNEEMGTSASQPLRHMPPPNSYDEPDRTTNPENSDVVPVRKRRTSSFDSLYDDSDDESVQDQTKSSPGTDSTRIGQDPTDHTDAEKISNLHQSTASSRPDSIRSNPPTSPITAINEKPSLSASATLSPRSTADETQVKSNHTMPQQTITPSLGDGILDTTDQEASSVSEMVLPGLGEGVDLGNSLKDTSAQPLDPNAGDEQQVQFLSGLLNFSFDHDIDLPLTPRGAKFESTETMNLPKASRNEGDKATEVVTETKVTQPDIRLVVDGSAPDSVNTEDQAKESSSNSITVDSSADQSIGDEPNTNLAVPTVPPISQTVGKNEKSVNNAAPLPNEVSNNRDSYLNYYYYTHQNDPFHRRYPEERKNEIPEFTTPNRPPPPIPSLSIPLTPNEVSVIGEGLLSVDHSFDDGIEPLNNRQGSALEKALYQDDRSSFQSERSMNTQAPASPASTRSHRGTSSVTSMDSSYLSRDSASTQTQVTTVTASLPNSARIISDPVQHEKMRLGITKAIGQLAQPPTVRHRISNLASKLNPKTASERNAKALQLALAVRGGDASRVLLLIQAFEKSADISTPVSIEGDAHPITALMRAAKLRETDCMDTLLKYDPQSIGCIDIVGQTALHHALAVSASNAALWLITHLGKADEINFRGRDGHKVIDIKDKHGVAAVHLAARLNDVVVIEALHKAGADLGARDLEGGTVLGHAVAACSSNAVQYLIKQNLYTDINSRNAKGETALMIAARANDELSVRILLENGAEKSIRDNNGDMAIHYAARCGTLSILELLFQSIEDVKAKNSIGEQPIHLAAAENHVNILSALLQLPGVQINAWTEPPHLRQPVKRSEGMAATTKMACTALHYACSAGHYEAADILLTRGAKANGNQEDGFSPLMMACQAQNAAIVSLLLLHGADPKGSTATDGMTALHIACKVNDVPCTKMLLEHGANPLARLTKAQETPTSLAFRHNSVSQRHAANLCVRYQEEVLRATSRIKRTPTFPSITTQPPNIRPMMSGQGFSPNRTSYPIVGSSGPPRAYLAVPEEQPPPPYQA